MIKSWRWPEQEVGGVSTSTGLRWKRRLRLLQLLHLEHDHGLIDALQQGVGEAGAAIEEAALEDVEQQELDQGPSRQAVEELLLVEAATVEIAFEEGGREAEGFLAGAVLEDLLGFEGAVGVVAGDPVAEALGEGVVIEGMLQITHGAIHHSDGIHQAFVMHELGPEEADVPGRGLHVAQLAALEVVAAADAVSDDPRIWIAGDGLEFGGGFRGEAFVGIDIEDPGITKGDIAQSPVLVGGPVIEGAFDDACGN